MFSSHGHIINVLKAEGKSHEGGVCYGVAQMARLAMLANDPLVNKLIKEAILTNDPLVKDLVKESDAKLSSIDEYNRRNEVIRSIKTADKYQKKREAAKKKKSSHLTLTTEDSILLEELPPFLQGVEIYFRGDKFVEEGCRLYKLESLPYDNPLPYQYSYILIENENKESKPGLYLIEHHQAKLVKVNNMDGFKQWVETIIPGQQSFVHLNRAQIREANRINGEEFLLNQSQSYSQDDTQSLFDDLLLPRRIAATRNTIINRNHVFCGLYNEDDLNDYFNSLEKILVQYGQKYSLAITLSSGTHTIEVGYDPELGWLFCNAGKIHRCSNPSHIANQVIIAFSSSQDSKGRVALSTSLSVVSSHSDHLKNCLIQWKKTTEWQNIHKSSKMNDDLLLIAALNGNNESTRNLLCQATNPNIADKEGFTPLILAAQNGHTENVRILLDKNANPNLANKEGITPLLMAVKHGHAEIVQMLLDKHAHQKPTEKDRYTPIITAANLGHNHIVRMLLAHNADPNVIDKYGETALIKAASKGYIEIAQMLLDNNADPNVLNKTGTNALLKAVQQRHTEIVRMLLNKNANPNITSKDGLPTWIIAALYGDINCAKLLLEATQHSSSEQKEIKTTNTPLLSSETFNKWTEATKKFLERMDAKQEDSQQQKQFATIKQIANLSVALSAKLETLPQEAKLSASVVQNKIVMRACDAYLSDSAKVIDVVKDLQAINAYVEKINSFFTKYGSFLVSADRKKALNALKENIACAYHFYAEGHSKDEIIKNLQAITHKIKLQVEAEHNRGFFARKFGTKSKFVRTLEKALAEEPPTATIPIEQKTENSIQNKLVEKMAQFQDIQNHIELLKEEIKEMEEEENNTSEAFRTTKEELRQLTVKASSISAEIKGLENQFPKVMNVREMDVTQVTGERRIPRNG